MTIYHNHDQQQQQQQQQQKYQRRRRRRITSARSPDLPFHNDSTKLSCIMTTYSLLHILMLYLQLGSLRAFPSLILCPASKNSYLHLSSQWKDNTQTIMPWLSFRNGERQRNHEIHLESVTYYQQRFIRLPFYINLGLSMQLHADDPSYSSIVESMEYSSDISIRKVMGRHQRTRSLQYDTIPAMVQYLHALSTAPMPVPKTDMDNNSLYRTLTNAISIDNKNQISSPTAKNTSSVQYIQVALVRLGMIWSQQQQQQQQQRQDLDDMSVSMHDSERVSESMIHVTSAHNRVPGCISTVHIETTICYYPNHKTSNATIIVQSIRGTTDSYMSRGLLACIANLFLNVTVDEILTLDIPHLIQQLSFATVLSQGRNDGFTNMIRVIQSQVKDCLNRLPPLYNTINVVPPVASSSQPTSALLTNSAPKSLSTSLSLPIVKTKTRVALLLSGGVDSSVALNLLVRNKEVQYDVTAFYLKIWLEDELSDLNVCPWEDDIQYCTAVCQQLNVPLETISLQEEYNDYILSYTINEAKNGRTPNPDILCNRRIKFGCFYDVIMNRDFDYVATGHYAQVVHHTTTDGTVRAHLHRAPDPVKDQSYFLCALTQAQLQRVLFPIGHLSKVEVRHYADQFELPNRYRPDSQGLCFLGKVKFDAFLNTYIADQPGPIIDATNNVLVGYHRGLWYHTIGQRKGLGKVLFPKATSIGPWYVVGKNTNTNTIYCTNQYDEDVFTQTRSEFAVEAIHWISGTPPLSSLLLPHRGDESIEKVLRDWSHANDRSLSIFDLKMKIRHGPNLVHGYLIICEDECTKGCNKEHKQGFIYLLNSKDSGLAPGQYVSFYDTQSAECYGCAVISENNWEGANQSILSTQGKITNQT